MCGIAGIKRLGANSEPITIDQLRLLACALEHRGADATGIALMTDGKIQVHKSDDGAWRFVSNKSFTTFLEEHLTEQTMTALVHTRFATLGSPRVNANNHPVMSDKVAIVHNGHISNHDTLFKDNKWERGAEVDSDIIRAYVEAYGITPEAIRKMSKDLAGSCASACLHEDYPEHLLLLRSGSPLEVARVGNNLFFASTKPAIYKASTPWESWGGFHVKAQRPPMAVAAIADNSGFIIGPERMEFHDEFRACGHYNKPDYTRVRTEFMVRKARWDKDTASQLTTRQNDRPLRATVFEGGKSVTYYWCRKTDCYCKMTMPEDQKNTPLWELHCPRCQTTLAPAPVAVTQ